jgi:hypothetical protein
MKLLAPLVAVVAFILSLVRRLLGRQRVARVETAQAMDASVERADEAKDAVTAQTAEAVAPHVAEAEAVVVEVAATKTVDRAVRRGTLYKLAKRVDE